MSSECARGHEVLLSSRVRCEHSNDGMTTFKFCHPSAVPFRAATEKCGKVIKANERQERKAEAFRALHAGEAFVIPNPWDAGSARVLEALGFQALATTSSGFAFTLGRLDGDVTLDEVAEHAAAVDRVTELPLSVDLENGYGADPESAARAITRIAATGSVGGSVEDYDLEGSSTGRRRPSSGSRRPSRLPARSGSRSPSPPGPRTTSTETPTSTTRSRASRPSSRPGPTSSTRPGSARRERSRPSARPCPGRSTCSRCRGCRWPRSSTPARNA